MSGITGSWISFVVIFRMILFPKQEFLIDGGLSERLIIPLVFAAFTMPYLMRGLRLLTMYNIHMRDRWGRVLRERSVVKMLIILFVVIEAVLWPVGLLCEQSR